MLRRFIENPVLSTVISIIIVILGLLGLYSLPITQYPEIAPPTVQVTANYQGANAEAVMKSVIIPLEEQINGVEDMAYMNSKASNDGSAVITITFTQGADADMAAVNVQNRVSQAMSQLPEEVIKQGVTTTKRLSSEIFSFLMYSEGNRYDQAFLENYARINLLPKIKRINGVGDASIYGGREYSMRIWLKPNAMASYGLTPSDIVQALQEQNVEAAPGKVGENSKQSFQYALKYTGRLETPEEFGDIIIRSNGTGKILRLSDVAEIDLGAYSYAMTLTAYKQHGTYIAVNQTAGSNAHEIIKQCEELLREAEKDLPAGAKFEVYSNSNDFLLASIDKLIATLIEAFVLVFIVVLVFLQDWRSTLIPAIAVPVAIVGTFFFLNLFGFSINLLTLFALVLSIGIVVDDAIIVVEAVHAKLYEGAESAKKATVSAMSELTTAIISITLVMSAVFVPVTFINGSVGVFYKEFGITLAVAILISAINALTLSPALCAIMLKPESGIHEEKRGFVNRFKTAFNSSFDRMTNRYVGVLGFLNKNKWLSLGSIVVFGALFVFLTKTTPTGFVPNEDSASIYGNIILAPSTSLEETERISNQIDSIAMSIPEVKFTSRLAGMDFFSGNGSSYAVEFIKLKHWKDRPNPEQNIHNVVAQLFAKTAHIKDANIVFFAAPTLQGFGNSSGFEIQLQDKTGGDYKKFEEVIGGFLGALNERPEIMYATSSFNTNFPQFEVSVNVAKAKEANVSVTEILTTLQGYLGGIYATNFNRFGKQYKVMIQADPNFRENKEAIDRLYVKNAQGVMSPITAFIDLKKVYSPEFLTRFNLFNSAFVNGSPNAGYSSGDAIRAIEEVAAQKLPQGYGFEYSGLSREESGSGNQTAIIFALSILFVYFLLSAQFKSYILPLAVLFSLPIGLAGAFIFAKIFGIENNIFLQISLIMLIGLLAKNAILIVEFALQRRQSGQSISAAAIEGARIRLRPILMTSFAFIFGLLPLMMATGAGALSNKSIGTAAVGGMLIGTLIGVLVIPSLFILFQSIQEKFTGAPVIEEEE
ncbi:efflux RND transporter permease subunit [Myroides marinus]|uniref:Hydrophobic/amphiphilic exporter-1, HAE1 family n=1 Tax=Myroides marinus TaxID=703342 RepID=A0A1H6XAS6_9FLAO|nr:efflux RND transporter permease subunit [Myroides marinus]KUF44500.1 multidrug transporter AcrB [Myroides marinus]MDM1355471.1 efflux RND transporter permease subunit [Myroides marinus]MDM1371466.1 efflux RND transporter permease subunit [Myroides marinus]MDM1376566.1 efflux RND transporter permease subunit [Myroides marinus]MDM1380009.1 efflux RND transporter permease subunit [Myroides marinus]